MFRNDYKKIYIYTSLSILVIVLGFIFQIRKTELVNKQIRTESPFTVPHKKDHYLLYNDNATFTFITYFSFDCRHCRDAFLLEKELLSSLPEKIKNTTNIIYRHNPLVSQPLSFEKAVISECVYNVAGDNGFFMFMNDMFSGYVESKDNAWVLQLSEKYLKDKNSFATCIKSQDTHKKVQLQKNENIISGITYTPTMLVFKGDSFVANYDGMSGKAIHIILRGYFNSLSSKNK